MDIAHSSWKCKKLFLYRKTPIFLEEKILHIQSCLKKIVIVFIFVAGLYIISFFKEANIYCDALKSLLTL